MQSANPPEIDLDNVWQRVLLVGLLYFLMLFDRLAADGVLSAGPTSGPS